MSEYRILEKVADTGEVGSERVHLAQLDRNRSLCGSVLFDGSPFDPWQVLGEDGGPEDYAGDGERCLACWEKWEGEKRADREARGLWNPPERTHKRKARRPVNKQLASQRIANRITVEPMPEPAGKSPERYELIRMYRHELEALGTADALAEIARRDEKRKARRARKVAA